MTPGFEPSCDSRTLALPATPTLHVQRRAIGVRPLTPEVVAVRQSVQRSCVSCSLAISFVSSSVEI